MIRIQQYAQMACNEGLLPQWILYHRRRVQLSSQSIALRCIEPHREMNDPFSGGALQGRRGHLTKEVPVFDGKPTELPKTVLCRDVGHAGDLGIGLL
jgi:hypothetical protein